MLKRTLKMLLQTNSSSYKEKETSSAADIQLKKQNIHSNIEKNLIVFKEIFSVPKNTDISIHDFQIGGYETKAAVLSIPSITDSKKIDECILMPLLENQFSSKHLKDILFVQSIKQVQQIDEILTEMNQGNAILFCDGEEIAYSMSVQDFKSRSIEKAENETVIKGPKEAFVENIQSNISLIRKRIKNESLIIETVTVSKRSKNDVFLVYMNDLANEKMLDNIKKRLGSLNVDSIQNLPLLEQHIEERKLSIFPTILNTERPDRAVSFIENGYIVLLMDTSPDSLVVPATFWSFYHTSEDHYLRFLYGNFTRALRLIAIFITIFTSAIYVGITNYHSEMVPPDLLLAIAATREKVPFPAIVEVLLMELAFELIREGGLRVPSPIGPTIGIVGALILGQAAVQANIVSPIVVIVVALSGLCSFTVGDLSMNFAIRLVRFLFIAASGLFGIFGMTALFVAGLFYMVSLKSFGVPYLAPMTPRYYSSKDTIFRRTLQSELFRPGYVKPKDLKKS